MAQKRIVKEFINYLAVIIIAVVFALTIRVFIFEPYMVPTPSMEPVLLAQDRVIVNKLTFRFRSPQRGELVVFKSPSDAGKDLVKRAIGLPGEEIQLTADGEIYINGHLLNEDYLVYDQDLGYLEQTMLLSSEQYFVLGDNRGNSLDSRFFGPIEENEIFGNLVFVYWPPQRIRKI